MVNRPRRCLASSLSSSTSLTTQSTLLSRCTSANDLLDRHGVALSPPARSPQQLRLKRIIMDNDINFYSKLEIGLAKSSLHFYRAHWMQGGLVTRKLSLRLAVCPSNAWFVTKRKKIVPKFLHHMKVHLPSFVIRRMVGGGDPFCLKCLVKLSPLERKRRFSIDIRS